MREIPVSAVIPTSGRSEILRRTLESLSGQSRVPCQLIVIDASSDAKTASILNQFAGKLPAIIVEKASEKGAAVQRVQGIRHATQSTLFFLDDDLLFEPQCIERIWKGFESEPNVGAVNAMITNQKYTPPGRLTRAMYNLMSGEKAASFAGRVIGPAWNLLPEDREGLPDYVRCDWLNTTCTMYNRSALPEPIFDSFFKGYSMMEDVSLSLTIARTHTLLNARTARIYHDSQPGSHKDNLVDLSAMELTNRHYVMTNVLSRKSTGDYIKLAIFEIFSLLSCFRTVKTLRQFPWILVGKLKAIVKALAR